MSTQGAADRVRAEVERLEENNHRRHRRNLEAEALMEVAAKIAAEEKVSGDRSAPAIAARLRQAAGDLTAAAPLSAGERIKRTLLSLPHPQHAAAAHLRRLADRAEAEAKTAGKESAQVRSESNAQDGRRSSAATRRA